MVDLFPKLHQINKRYLRAKKKKQNNKWNPWKYEHSGQLSRDYFCDQFLEKRTEIESKWCQYPEDMKNYLPHVNKIINLF